LKEAIFFSRTGNGNPNLLHELSSATACGSLFSAPSAPSLFSSCSYQASSPLEDEDFSVRPCCVATGSSTHSSRHAQRKRRSCLAPAFPTSSNADRCPSAALSMLFFPSEPRQWRTFYGLEVFTSAGGFLAEARLFCRDSLSLPAASCCKRG